MESTRHAPIRICGTCAHESNGKARRCQACMALRSPYDMRPKWESRGKDR